MSSQSEMYDVAIVGYGPVGATLAILLGQLGRRVVVVERHAQPYPLLRAVHYDHEVARILQACGVAEACSKIVEPAEVYEFVNAERRPLMRIGRAGPGLSGWPQSSMFSQPELEAVLSARVAELPDVEVRRGVEVIGMDHDGDGVTLHLSAPASPLRARYLVGCDGANSTVRQLVGLTMTDRAFCYDWLIVDVVFSEPRIFDPPNYQVCDPARPTSVISGGPGRRRWEFMALPSEAIDDLNDEATAWRLLEPWDVRPDNARLERHAVYRFHARWVDEWRRGRILLAGDAAHQTPPFAGQGMCAGMRDAINLAWKLDLVLGGTAPDELLDTYGSERGPHVKAIIELAIELGKVICVADPDEAAARDAMFLSTYDGGITKAAPLPAIGPGLVRTGSPKAGELFLQAEVERSDHRARFDDLLGAGWRLVSMVDLEVNPELREWFEGLGGRIVALTPGGDLRDVGGAYGKWFAEHGVIAALQRPDFAVFGTARTEADGTKLLDALRAACAHPSTLPA